jgi:hypothetical protein
MCTTTMRAHSIEKMLDLQHQYNNCTIIPHMRVGPTYWGPPSCEGLLYSCCIGVVQESNLISLCLVNCDSVIVVYHEYFEHSPRPKISHLIEVIS